MRSNQVTINIERYGKYVPKDYPADVQRINVYCDDFNSIYVALSKAYALAINELAEYENIGVRADVYTNEFSRDDYGEMQGALLETKNKYEDDVNLQYYDTDLQLCEDRIWVYENAESILEVLRECDESEVAAVKLKDKFGLSDYQIRKLFQMRFDMMTQAKYKQAKEKIETHKEVLNNKESRALYRDIEKRKLHIEIEKLKAYFKFVEHYEEIVKIVLDTESFYEVEKVLQERFGLTRQQAGAFKYFELNEFSKKEQKIKEEQLKNLEERLKLCCED